LREFVAAGGSFTLDGFTPGEWSLGARAKEYGDSRPVRVTVPASAPVELVLKAATSVKGLVLDPNGAPVARATARPSGGDEGRTDAQGAFPLYRLPAGPLTLTASASGFAPSEPLELEVATGQAIDGAVLRLRVGGTITGEVLGLDAQPESERSVS